MGTMSKFMMAKPYPQTVRVFPRNVSVQGYLAAMFILLFGSRKLGLLSKWGTSQEIYRYEVGTVRRTIFYDIYSCRYHTVMQEPYV